MKHCKAVYCDHKATTKVAKHAKEAKRAKVAKHVKEAKRAKVAKPVAADRKPDPRTKPTALVLFP